MQRVTEEALVANSEKHTCSVQLTKKEIEYLLGVNHHH